MTELLQLYYSATKRKTSCIYTKIVVEFLIRYNRLKCAITKNRKLMNKKNTGSA